MILQPRACSGTKKQSGSSHSWAELSCQPTSYGYSWPNWRNASYAGHIITAWRAHSRPVGDEQLWMFSVDAKGSFTETSFLGVKSFTCRGQLQWLHFQSGREDGWWQKEAVFRPPILYPLKSLLLCIPPGAQQRLRESWIHSPSSLTGGRYLT